MSENNQNDDQQENNGQIRQAGDNDETIQNRNPPPEPEPVIGNPRDVLCGRGLHILNHHGNLQLHLLVNKNRNQYRQSRRQEKSRIIRAIIRETKKSGARFLQRIAGDGDDRWVEVDDKTAYEKVSHALRLQRVNESTKLQAGPADEHSLTQQNIASAAHQYQAQSSLFPTQAQAAGLQYLSGATSLPQHHHLQAAATSQFAQLPQQQLLQQLQQHQQQRHHQGSFPPTNMGPTNNFPFFNPLQRQLMMSLLSNLGPSALPQALQGLAGSGSSDSSNLRNSPTRSAETVPSSESSKPSDETKEGNPEP